MRTHSAPQIPSQTQGAQRQQVVRGWGWMKGDTRVQWERGCVGFLVWAVGWWTAKVPKEIPELGLPGVPGQWHRPPEGQL